MISDETQAPWRRFALNFAIAAAALTLMLFGFNVTLDPFGIRASPTQAPTPLMDVNQRFMYPQVVRSGQFDSGGFRHFDNQTARPRSASIAPSAASSPISA